MLWHVSTSLKQFGALNGYCCHSLSDTLWTVGLHLRNASTWINVYCSKTCTDECFTVLSGVTGMHYRVLSGMIQSFKSQCGKTRHNSETSEIRQTKEWTPLELERPADQHSCKENLRRDYVPIPYSHFCFQPYHLMHTDPCRSAGIGEE